MHPPVFVLVEVSCRDWLCGPYFLGQCSLQILASAQMCAEIYPGEWILKRRVCRGLEFIQSYCIHGFSIIIIFLADWLFYLLTSVEPHFCLKRRARCPHEHVYSFTIIIFSITNASSSHIRCACTPPLSLFAEKNWSIYAYALKRFFFSIYALKRSSIAQSKCLSMLSKVSFLTNVDSLFTASS